MSDSIKRFREEFVELVIKPHKKRVKIIAKTALQWFEEIKTN